MPIVLLWALAGSLALHAFVLFGTALSDFADTPDTPVLQAVLQPPPILLPPPAAPRAARLPSKPAAMRAPLVPRPAPVATDEALPVSAENALPSWLSALNAAPAQPARPLLPARGSIRFTLYKESLGLEVGRAEHHWEFAEDGSYRLSGVTETSGLAALFKPLRLVIESRGRLVAGGLQPATFRSLKNGKETNENADFDWATASVRLARDGSEHEIVAGTQDILSLNYQLAFLGNLAEGRQIGVVTGKKYERYALDSLGEEEIETPAGRFRTLHLRAMTDSTTEIWIALDQYCLPVKIRFTDKKGESFTQVASEIGSP
jgi:hypothetical protein